ncbi:GNAT family N-acetyltransferase [Leuconostoc citreum]|uniref:GNAT family N-acetyltransferase n=1 Tax=Leuconostoc citreum TaxID=33964 RepID=UPI0011BBDCDA|nr:GNAT family N-acetyltransferase [Leuconostoc citreum]QEA45818.1 GNAT family N-acetyltransferase [Leuconostoc citreum]QEA62506.1 GNAT family N-acetyltransferase [Leuconostoc citreum]
MKIRPLEKRDLPYIYQQENSRKVMALWFQEAYTSFDELQLLYERHVLDQTERRFVVEDKDQFIGVVELMYIDGLHRHTEIQVIIHPDHQGHGYAQSAIKSGIEYAFKVLNMHKVYLYVDVDNAAAIHIYKKVGFTQEGVLRGHFFAEGKYHDSMMMGILAHEFIAN